MAIENDLKSNSHSLFKVFKAVLTYSKGLSSEDLVFGASPFPPFLEGDLAGSNGLLIFSIFITKVFKLVSEALQIAFHVFGLPPGI